MYVTAKTWFSEKKSLAFTAVKIKFFDSKTSSTQDTTDSISMSYITLVLHIHKMSFAIQHLWRIKRQGQVRILMKKSEAISAWQPRFHLSWVIKRLCFWALPVIISQIYRLKYAVNQNWKSKKEGWDFIQSAPSKKNALS